MKLDELFRKSIARVREEGIEFAVCGGIAAMLYRDQPRYTGDIDILIAAADDAVEIATQIIESFGLTPTVLREAQLSLAPRANKRASPIAVILGRDGDDKNAPGLDFLLPRQAWTKKALERAKLNIISLNGIKAPFITAEDMLLAKFTAVMQGGGRRPKDADDIIAIVSADRPLDVAYVAAEVERLKLNIPTDLAKTLPKGIGTVFKRLRRGA